MATYQAPPRPTLGPDDHGRPVSADKFADAEYAVPWKYEREDGRLVVMPPDGQDHNDIAEPWRDELVLYKRLTRPGHVQMVKSEAWIRVGGGTDRIGDLAVYLASDRPVLPIPDRVPDLVFEIVSPGRLAHERDYLKKRDDYFRLGVREYVITDRFERKVTVLTHTPGGYAERVLTAADTYTSPLLPGLAVPLAEILGT